MNPAGYHVTNNLLRAVGAAVFFCVTLSVMRAALRNRAAWDPSLGADALVAALAFGTHPLGVESVARITERRAVLSGPFCFQTVWAYL